MDSICFIENALETSLQINPETAALGLMPQDCRYFIATKSSFGYKEMYNWILAQQGCTFTQENEQTEGRIVRNNVFMIHETNQMKQKSEY